MIEERLLAAKQYVKTLFADRADGHDVEHTLRVYTNAMRIAQAEGSCDLEIVGLSALLHMQMIINCFKQRIMRMLACF